MDSFDPTKLSGFEGYVAGKLEGIEGKIKGLPCEKHCDEIKKISNEVANIKGRATVFGAVMGFVSGLVGSIFFKK